jgi:cyclic pyranopterin phosphate synthase
VQRDPTLDSGDLLALIRQIHALLGIAKVRFTGGEPLLRRDLPALIAACHEMSISDISLTTNGQRLSELAGPLRRAGLDRINVSLDSLDPATYASITRGGKLDACLAGIEAAFAHGLHPIKLNMVVMRGVNDSEVTDMAEFGLQHGCHVRFLEFMPIGIAASEAESRFVPSSVVRGQLSQKFQLTQIPHTIGETSRNYLASDRFGRKILCGFISPISETFCQGCKRLRLTHDGRLIGCLARDENLDLVSALHAFREGKNEPLLGALDSAFAAKSRPRNMAEQHNMVGIGG